MAYNNNTLLLAVACCTSFCACLRVVTAFTVGETSVSNKRRDYDSKRTSQQASLTAGVKDAKLELEEQFKALKKRTNSGTGSTYVRWGRKTCPNNAVLVYSGVAGGKLWSETGGGTNRLCLTFSPQFDDVVRPADDLLAKIYGSEYQFIGSLHDHDVPCAVCRVPQTTILMIPGTLTCPPGWTPQYTGHLSGERFNHQGGEYVCLDYNPEPTNSGVFNHDGNLFYYVATVCGSLPCPPYAGNKVMTCVVCSY